MSSETSSGAASNLCAFEREKAGDLECRLGEIEEEREGPAIRGTGVSSRGVTPFPFPIFPNMDMMLSGNFEFFLKAGSVPYILSTVTGRLAYRAVYKDTSLGACVYKRKVDL
jgi:hypothetical protein